MKPVIFTSLSVVAIDRGEPFQIYG